MASTSLCQEVANEMLAVPAAVIYDHLESGCRAKAFLDQVSANAGDENLLNLALWRMDSLAQPDTTTGAIQDLGRSVILVLALRPGAELLKSVFDWVECWAHSRAGDDSALVVLGSAHTAAVGELEQIAQRRGIALFCEPTAQPGWGWQNCLEDLQRREQTPLPLLEVVPGSSRSGYNPHWGLNE